MYFIISNTVINISNVTIISISITTFPGGFANRFFPHPILLYLLYHTDITFPILSYKLRRGISAPFCISYFLFYAVSVVVATSDGYAPSL